MEKARLSKRPAKPVAGALVREPPVPVPAAWLKFAEGLQPPLVDETTESVRSTACRVDGNKALWKRGVSGSALAFDGYFSKVTLPRDKAPAIGGAITVEAWIALGAYPWNDAGIVHCSTGTPINPEDYKHGIRDPYTYRPWAMQGWLLGIDPYGRPIFKVNGRQVGGGEVPPDRTIPQASVLPTYRWTHLAATCGGGAMRLFVDGELVEPRCADADFAPHPAVRRDEKRLVDRLGRDDSRGVRHVPPVDDDFLGTGADEGDPRAQAHRIGPGSGDLSEGEPAPRRLETRQVAGRAAEHQPAAPGNVDDQVRERPPADLARPRRARGLVGRVRLVPRKRGGRADRNAAESGRLLRLVVFQRGVVGEEFGRRGDCRREQQGDGKV
jgi:hypothetical protein